jgi:hypothetical protein
MDLPGVNIYGSMLDAAGKSKGSKKVVHPPGNPASN